MSLYILFTFVVLIPFALSGCEQDAQAASAFGPDDLTIYLDGTRYYLDMDILDVIAVLGDDYDFAQSISCEHDGYDKSFLYDGIEFYTYPLPHGDIVFEIFTTDPGASTTRGIRIGATAEEVLAAYGSDGVVNDFEIVYSLPACADFPVGASLCFDLRDGVVTAIFATARAW